MKKYAYLILLSFTGVLFIIILAFSKEKTTIPTFKERHGNIGLSAEWLNTKQAIEGLLYKLKQNSTDYKSMLALAQAYIQEARVTGNHGYYDKTSLDLIEQVIKKEPENFEALTLKAVVLLSQHHFKEALDIGKRAELINADNAFIYGILCDANVELGNYPQAVKMADKMVSIRPDIRSYSRIAYLREIYGDYPGSIEAMKMALAAGYPGLEQTEWVRINLGQLYEKIGKLDSAQLYFSTSLIHRPNYPYALAGLARIEKINKNYKQAIQTMEKAKSLMLEYSFSDELTDLYELNNEPLKQKKSAYEVIKQLSSSQEDESENFHGHYADKELAYAYLKFNQTEKALEHAMLEYERRPNNMDVCEALAWVHFARGEFVKANNIIDKALITHSNNAVLLCRAGLIKCKVGESKLGTELIEKAFKVNPFLESDLKNKVLQIIPLS